MVTDSETSATSGIPILTSRVSEIPIVAAASMVSLRSVDI